MEGIEALQQLADLACAVGITSSCEDQGEGDDEDDNRQARRSDDCLSREEENMSVELAVKPAFDMSTDQIVKQMVQQMLYQVRTIACETCGKQFLDQLDLAKHKHTHNATNRLPCHACGKTFRDRTDLKRHYRVHTGEKPYTCQMCNKAFSDKSDLTKHLRTHSRERPFSCDDCGKRFRQKGGLKKHRLSHVKDTTEILACRMCDKDFTSVYALSSHFQAHLTCPRCSVTFESIEERTFHIRDCVGA